MEMTREQLILLLQECNNCLWEANQRLKKNNLEPVISKEIHKILKQ